MAMYRVKAFFLHERETDAAKQAEQKTIITNAEWTDGYVIGVIDEAHVPELVKQGLVIIPVERVETRTPSDASRAGQRRLRSGASQTSRGVRLTSSTAEPGQRPLKTSMSGQTDLEKIDSEDRLNPAFYVVRLNGPLTQERRQLLDQHDIRLLERLNGDNYTTRLAPADVRRLAAQYFVDQIRLYNEADTLRADEVEDGSATRRPSRGDAPLRFTRLFAVRTHRPEDLQNVKQWLERRGRTVFLTHADTLRVALVQDGNDFSELAELSEVANVEEVVPAQFYDQKARQILRIEQPDKPAFGFEGEGQIIGIADTGLDDNHPDFAGRIIGISPLGRPGDYSDPEGHGTHVAGCALGDGRASNGEVRGAAPQARLFFQSILDAHGGLGGLPSDLDKLFGEAYKKGVRIHNNSWGAFAFAQYSLTSRDVDSFVAANPDMLIVIAAGNDGIATPRVKGGTKNADNGYVDWPSVAAPATAKNGLSVGASRNSRTKGGYATLTWADAWGDRYPGPPIGKQSVSGDINSLAAFSGRGPSDDFRIKPDVVAPGTDIAAARSRQAPLFKFWGAYPNDPNYAFMGGTSMAAPYVAGCAALVREYFEKKENWATPSAALLKATLINGTTRMTGEDAIASREGEPNFHQGFGRIDMARTIPNPISPDVKFAFVDTWKDPLRIFKSPGQRMRYQISVGGGVPLRICLAWTDIPGRGLQNQLFLLVEDLNGKKFSGNSSAATNFVPVSGMTADPHNNVQIVRINNPKAGTYTIAVTATQLQKPSQAIALAVTGDLQSSLILMG
jgi:serine protease AprX